MSNNPNNIDWSYWASLPIVDYKDACALCRGYDPKAIRGNALPPDLDAELKRLEYIAKSNLGHSLPSYATDDNRTYGASTETGVRLAEFRAWGESLPYPLRFPDEFPRAATPTTDPAVGDQASEKPRNKKEENSLLNIIAAMLALLQMPRAEGGGAFPSESLLIDVLVKKFGKAQGVSKRNLQGVFPRAKRAAGDDLEPKNGTADS